MRRPGRSRCSLTQDRTGWENLLGESSRAVPTVGLRPHTWARHDRPRRCNRAAHRTRSGRLDRSPDHRRSVGSECAGRRGTHGTTCTAPLQPCRRGRRRQNRQAARRCGRGVGGRRTRSRLRCCSRGCALRNRSSRRRRRGRRSRRGGRRGRRRDRRCRGRRWSGRRCGRRRRGDRWRRSGGRRCRRRSHGRRRRGHARRGGRGGCSGRQKRRRVHVALSLRGETHAEVDVRLRHLGVAARPDRADGVTLGDCGALRHDERAEMGERDGVAVGGLDRQAHPGRGDGARKGDCARGGRCDGGAGRAADVESAVLAGGVRVRRIEVERLQDVAGGGPGPRTGCGHEEQRTRHGEEQSSAHSTTIPSFVV